MNQNITVVLQGEHAERFNTAYDMGIRKDYIIPMALVLIVEYLKAQKESAFIAKVDKNMNISKLSLTVSIDNEAESN